jgi:heterotetrameric sarcosine oxidase gamma subunit
MRTSTRTGGGCVFDIVARSPIAPASPVVVDHGWEVSGRRAEAALTITDCTPLTKVQVRAPIGGQAAAALGVRFGRAARDAAGTLVVGSGPGEWLLLAAPGRVPALGPEAVAAQSPGESVTWVDQTHGRALVRLSGPHSPSLLVKLCGIDLDDDITPDGSAFRTSVAALATDVIRDDLVSGPGPSGSGVSPGRTVSPRRSTACTRSYLLHCERSSGQYLFDALLRAGAESGIEIDGFRMPDALPDRPTSPHT